MNVETGPITSDGAARERVQRQYASLQTSAGWLLGQLEEVAGDLPPPGASFAARILHAVRHPGWPSRDKDRLLAFAERFSALEAEAEKGGDTPDLATRLERASAEALSLYVAFQAEVAAREAALFDTLPDADDEEARRKALAAYGESVRSRLDADPRAQALPVWGFEIYRLRGFITPEQCAELIALIDRDPYPSGVLGPQADPEFRTSRSCDLKLQDPVVDLVDRRTSALTGIDRRFSEHLQGQRYDVGQQFKPHHDFFHKGESYYEEAHARAGQRTWTGMLFLNEVERGGHTGFPHVGIQVKPETGTLLLWNNMQRDGRPNMNSLHTGMPVEAGRKYVITKWFRERPWR